ncbi:MAG: aspartyl protease family protein [Vulcanimicrobiaceae bacterium]
MYAARGIVTSRNYRETVEFASGDSRGSFVYTMAGRSWSVAYDDGIYRTMRGVVRSYSWLQDENGIVVAGQGYIGASGPDTGRPAPPPLGIVMRVSTPVDAWLVSALDGNGFGRKMYVDPQTYLPTRVETITVNGAIVTTYDDYRNESGQNFPHHWKIDDGVSRVVTDYRLLRVEQLPVDQTEIEWPKTSRELVEFPEGQKEVELPANFVGSRIYVRLFIGNRGLDFVLDTGAAGIVMDRAVADQLGLKTTGQHSVVVAQRTTAGLATVPEMRVGPLFMHNVVVQTVPASYIDFSHATRSVGLLGFDFLATLGVTIDYQRKTVAVCRTNDFMPPDGSDTLDARMLTRQPVVDLRINDILSHGFILDTGAPGQALLFDQFFRTHPDALKYFTARGQTEARGIGGSFEQESYRVHEVQLGSVVFRDYTLNRVLSRSSYNVGVDGLVGADFLSYFTVGLDYANQRVYLKRNDRRF